jgi:hypothetical protein
VKFLVSWKSRDGGSGEEREADFARALEVLGKWSPPGDVTFHQFLTRLDGHGGFAVVESDNAANVMEGPAKFDPWFEFTITPVVDIEDGLVVANEAIKFRNSVH